MHGGKREGAGRKSYGETKVYRLPVALEPEIKTMLEGYKADFDRRRNGEKVSVDEEHASRILEEMEEKEAFLFGSQDRVSFSETQIRIIQKFAVASGELPTIKKARQHIFDDESAYLFLHHVKNNPEHFTLFSWVKPVFNHFEKHQ